MKLCSIFKSKKGAALETAVIFMVVVFTLCFLLSTVTVIGHSRAKIDKIKLEQSIEVDRMIEVYMHYINTKGVPLGWKNQDGTAIEPQSLATFGNFVIQDLYKNTYEGYDVSEKVDKVEEFKASFCVTVTRKDDINAKIFEIEVVKESDGTTTIQKCTRYT